MPKYNPMDMAYVLKMQKKGQMTPEELQLMQNINQAMLPEVAAGNVGILPATQGGVPVGQQFMTPAQQMELMKMRGR